MTEADKFKFVKRILASCDETDPDILKKYKFSIIFPNSNGDFRLDRLGFNMQFENYDSFCFTQGSRLSFLDLVAHFEHLTHFKFKNIFKAYSKAISALKDVSSWEELELRLDIAGLQGPSLFEKVSREMRSYNMTDMTLSEKISLVERILKSGDRNLVALRYRISVDTGRIIVGGVPFDGKLHYDNCEDFCFHNNTLSANISSTPFLIFANSFKKSATYKNFAEAYSKVISVLNGASSWEEIKMRLDIAGLQ